MPSTEVDIKTPFEFTDAILVEYCSATVRAMAIRHFFFKNFQPIRELLLDSERANILILSLSVICVTVNLTSGFRGILTINPIPYPVAMVSLQYWLLLLLFSLVYRALFSLYSASPLKVTKAVNSELYATVGRNSNSFREIG